jgi:hypothetical protein
MSLWLIIVLLGLLKLPIAALMLWMPFRDDHTTRALASTSADPAQAEDSDEEGGSPALPASPPNPHPRSPRPRPRRRGPHDSGGGTPSPGRVRRPARADFTRVG